MGTMKRLSILATGCVVLAAGVAPASAQWYRDREYDERDWRRPGFSMRFGDFDEDRRWRRGRDRDRDCYYLTRRYRDRYGDWVERRSLVCED